MQGFFHCLNFSFEKSRFPIHVSSRTTHFEMCTFFLWWMPYVNKSWTRKANGIKKFAKNQWTVLCTKDNMEVSHSWWFLVAVTFAQGDVCQLTAISIIAAVQKCFWQKCWKSWMQWRLQSVGKNTPVFDG